MKPRVLSGDTTSVDFIELVVIGCRGWFRSLALCPLLCVWRLSIAINSLCSSIPFLFFQPDHTFSRHSELLVNSVIPFLFFQPDHTFSRRSALVHSVVLPHCSETIIGGSCHKYHFCRDETRLLSQQKYTCLDKVLSQQNYVCRDKIMFVATKYFCRDKSNTCLSQQSMLCRDKKFTCGSSRQWYETCAQRSLSCDDNLQLNRVQLLPTPERLWPLGSNKYTTIPFPRMILT